MRRAEEGRAAGTTLPTPLRPGPPEGWGHRKREDVS